MVFRVAVLDRVLPPSIVLAGLHSRKVHFCSIRVGYP